MKKTFACAVRPNKAPSMRCGLSIISLEHSYGLYGSRIFDPTQLAPKCNARVRRPECPDRGTDRGLSKIYPGAPQQALLGC